MRAMTTAHQVGASYWAAIEKRDWSAFAALLDADVIYELPQSRERIRGREAYVRFNIEYPGDWHVRVERVIGEDGQAATWTRFTVGGDTHDALTFLELGAEELIVKVTDFWPEPYDPPAGREHLVERF
jgi:hypothetical protein